MSLIVIFIDQLTKFLIYGTASRSIIGNLLWFESTLNTGVAFSLFQNSSWVFVITSSLAVCVFVYLIISKRFIHQKSEKICLGFILGGTLSNLIDRIIFGGVRDFIYLKFINFAIFNIADMAVSFGVAVLCFFIVFYDIKNSKKVTKVSKEEILKSDESQQNLDKSSHKNSTKKQGKKEDDVGEGFETLEK